MTATAKPPLVSMAEFDAIFESVKNWGRWGPDDQLGTLNYLTPAKVRGAAGLVRSGRQVSMEIPINKVAGPDNPNPAIHFVSQAHDIDIGSNGLRFGLDFLGMACHGDCHTHVDALCHISYKGQTYNGKPAQEVLTSKGATTLDITSYGNGLVGRGVLLDIPRFRGVKWLEPGEAVTPRRARGLREAPRASASARATSSSSGPATIGADWSSGRGTTAIRRGEGKAGLHVDTVPWMHERRIAAFLPDGDGEAVPSTVEGMLYPIHPLQIVAMGMLASDSLQFEDLAKACEEEGRFEFMVVGLPLRLPGGTGSPWNPIAIF